MDPITVLIVDDHTVAREGLRAMLETDDQVRVVGEAVDGADALAKVADLDPNIVLMDIRMPNLDGLEATRRIKAARPSTAVIVLTSYDDDALVANALVAGAAGYLLKDASREMLGRTIRAVADGNLVLMADLMRRAIDGLADTHRLAEEMSPRSLGGVQLTEREMEILELIVEGRSNREIGDRLHLAEVTIKKHVQGILSKLHVSDRTQAALTAVRGGLVR